MIKFLYHKASLCIANSQVNKKDLEGNFAVMNVVSIPNPFDIELISELSNQNIDIEKKKFTFIIGHTCAINSKCSTGII